MAKYRITLEIDTEPFSKEELSAEFTDEEIAEIETGTPTAQWLGHLLCDFIEDGNTDEMMFAGSDVFHRIRTVHLVAAEKMSP